MSTPTLQFSSLSLHSQMSQLSDAELLARKVEVRDILSSFNREMLPAEFKRDVFNQIDVAQNRRPSSEWTISGDLEGTILQWGVHDSDLHTVLTQMQSPETRAILFYQKLKRRLKAEFDVYRALPLWEQEDVLVDLTTAAEVRKKVYLIADRLRHLIQMAQIDRQQRPMSGDNPARIELFIETLRDICDSNENKLPERRHTTRSTSGGESGTSLYEALITQPKHGQDLFLLDLLGDFDIDVLYSFKPVLHKIANQLKALRAPIEYRERFQRLLSQSPMLYGGQEQSRASQTSEIAETSQSGAKRAAAESLGRTGRSGRRKTDK